MLFIYVFLSVLLIVKSVVIIINKYRLKKIVRVIGLGILIENVLSKYWDKFWFNLCNLVKFIFVFFVKNCYFVNVERF